MTLIANFEKGRCYFGTFDKNNDINPKTKRSGLNYYRFKLIGNILQKLGFASRINYMNGGKSSVIYLNTKSFNAWKDRHKADIGLNANAIDQSIANKKFEEAIQLICDNFANNWKIPFTVEEVMAKADERFSQHPYKADLLQDIKFHLMFYKNYGSIELDGRSRVFLPGEEAEANWHRQVTNSVFHFFSDKDIFANVTIGVAH